MKFDTVTIGTTRIPWPVLAAVIAAAPLLAVGVYRTMKQQPAPVSGVELVEAAAFNPPVDNKPSPAALALVSQFSAEATRGFGPSPMISRAPAAAPRPKPVPEPVVARAEPEPAPDVAALPPGITITSIMDGLQGQSFAVINGKIRRIGDNVGNGFAVHDINMKTGEVEIRNQLGDNFIYQIKKRQE